MGLSSKLTGAAKKSFAAFDEALRIGPPPGSISSRLVRSAFSVLEQNSETVSASSVPNLFPYPHNLSWYFGTCTCPQEVRVFATLTGRKHIRVWSVAQNEDGWQILAQVFGAETPDEAVRDVELETRRGERRLRHFSLGSIEKFDLPKVVVDNFPHNHVRALLSKDAPGHFVEVSLLRGC